MPRTAHPPVTTRSLKKERRPHWYFTYMDYCVLGGHTDVTRERRYGKRPERWDARHELHEHACYGCQYQSFM